MIIENHEEKPSEKIINAWKEQKLKEIYKENEKLTKLIKSSKKKKKIKKPKMLNEKQFNRLYKKYLPKKSKKYKNKFLYK